MYPASSSSTHGFPDYHKRLGWLRSKLAHYTYRWGLIRNDWATVRSGQKSFWDFIADRPTVQLFYRRRKIAKDVGRTRLCGGASL